MTKELRAEKCTYENLRQHVAVSFPSITYRDQSLGQIMAHVLDQCADRQVHAYAKDRVGRHFYGYNIRGEKEGMKIRCEADFTQIGSEMGFERIDHNEVWIEMKIPHTPFYRKVFRKGEESTYKAFPGAPIDTCRKRECIEPTDLDSRVMGLFDTA